MRHLVLLTVVGILLSCSLTTRAENLSSNIDATITVLDLTDRDTTVAKVDPENDGKKDEKKEVEEETTEAVVEVVIQLSPKQEKEYVEENMPTEDVNAIAIVITPSTRYNQPSEQIEETKVTKINEETGEEYFIRKSYAPSQFKKLQNKRRYKRRVNRLESKGMKSST